MRNRRDDELARLDPSAFESLIADHYRAAGYSVERIGHGGRHFDGGIDLKLRRGCEYVVVQCKRENAYQITHNVGHELIGVMCTQGATGAIVITSGEFTEHARESALGDARLSLVDGEEVRRWFPQLVRSTAHPQWEAVSVGTGSAARRRSRRRDDSGLKAAMVLAFLIALSLWQCNRVQSLRDNSQFAAEAQAAPVSRKPAEEYPTTVVGASSRSRDKTPLVENPSAAELEEWKRRNAESMEILRESTPEIDLAP